MRELLDTDRKYVRVRYLNSALDHSELTYQSIIRDVERSISKAAPDVVVGVSDDYLQYASVPFITAYRSRYVQLTFNSQPYNVALANAFLEVLTYNHMQAKPVYLMHDSSRGSSAMAQAFFDSLSDAGIDAHSIEVADVTAYRAELTSLASKPEGAVVNLLGPIPDIEFNTTWYHEETSALLAKSNSRHLDVGLNASDRNLSIIVGLDIVDVSAKAIASRPVITLNPRRLRQLGYEYVYSNSFYMVSGVVD